MNDTAWTQADLTAIEKAIASGATTVQYADKRVTYRSLDEMQRARRMIRQALGLASARKRRTVARYRSGL